MGNAGGDGGQSWPYQSGAVGMGGLVGWSKGSLSPARSKADLAVLTGNRRTCLSNITKWCGTQRSQLWLINHGGGPQELKAQTTPPLFFPP